MEEISRWPGMNEVYEDISKFDNTMFLVNPIRAMKFAELLSYTWKDSYLRPKLMIAVKDSSFWKIADAFQQAHSKDYRDLWESNLPKEINNFLEELEKNEKNNFSRNEIEEVKIILNHIFPLTQAEKEKKWIKNKVFSILD